MMERRINVDVDTVDRDHVKVTRYLIHDQRDRHEVVMMRVTVRGPDAEETAVYFVHVNDEVIYRGDNEFHAAEEVATEVGRIVEGCRRAPWEGID